MKLNPEYKRWKEAQNASSGSSAPATTVINADQALPVVSSMEGKQTLCVYVVVGYNMSCRTFDRRTLITASPSSSSTLCPSILTQQH